MKYGDLVNKVSDVPCFTAKFLAAGGDLSQIRHQLDRWEKSKKVIKIHKGLYTLAEPYRKVKPEPFYIANSLKSASYVSLQSALAWYGMIPEFVPEVTSVTTGRPQTYETVVGRFSFRHINKNFFWGYQQIETTEGQEVFIACPEKALLDLVYLTPGACNAEYIEELRLQNFEQIDKVTLLKFAEKTKSPKIRKAVNNIETIIEKGEGIEL
jgi:predicted transcriptional regulator of viral defense system